MTAPNSTVLGLDLGTNSIGWCLLNLGNESEPEVIDAGVRIFEEVVEPKTKAPKNEKRRMSR